MTDFPAAIRAALDAGFNTEALDLARSARFADPGSAEADYLGALACARMGAIDEAEKWLARVDRERIADSTLAADASNLAGRIAKDRFAATLDRSSSSARDYAFAAIEHYRRAFSLSGAAYPAVNAATMAMLSGQTTLAQDLARQALAAPGSASDQWGHATAGEALLLLGETDRARARYAEAYRLAGNRFGDIASMRRQLVLIDSDSARAMLAIVPAPRVIAFSGHMIDRPGRVPPRFPAQLEAKVALALRKRLAGIGAAIGFAQAACGADILFLEAMQDLGMQTHVVLPFARSDFINASVSFAGQEWVTRFERVLEHATSVVLATDEAFLDDDVLFEHAANLIRGMAMMRAAELSTQPLMVTVREPTAPEILGGTAATSEIWKRRGGEVDNIDLAALRGDDSGETPGGAMPRSPQSPARSASPRSVKSLLFADVSGFSRVPEQHTPEFVELFLRTCKSALDSLPRQPSDTNTRGDGLFVVFDFAKDAAELAVRLQSALNRIDWKKWGFADDAGVRIGLHTGPVFPTFDPVMSKTAFYGTHVTRAARLEPVVQPGHILVTEAFAATLLSENEERFDCHYIGAMPLAKHFGDARLYQLRWTGDR